MGKIGSGYGYNNDIDGGGSMRKPTYFTAVRNLVGGSMGGPDSGPLSEFIFNDGQTPPTDAECKTEMDRLEAEYETQEYARNRANEYPSIAELTVALYDTDDKAAIETKRAAVKAKYPKPS